MELNDKLKLLKDIKTARRLSRQARTMLARTAEKIQTETINCNSSILIMDISKAIDKECEKFDDCINEFKKEQQVAGYQYTIFD